MIGEWISSQSVFYQVLNSVQWWCLKKIFNGEIIFNLKRRLKRLRYYKWKAWYSLLSSLGLKKICMFLSSPPVILLRGVPVNIVTGHEVLFSNKGTNWKFIFPWRKINWHVLQIPKAHFSYLIWLMICGKSIIYAIFIMMMHKCTKSLNKQGIQNKLFTRISNSFSPSLLYFVLAIILCTYYYTVYL